MLSDSPQIPAGSWTGSPHDCVRNVVGFLEMIPNLPSINRSHHFSKLLIHQRLETGTPTLTHHGRQRSQSVPLFRHQNSIWKELTELLWLCRTWAQRSRSTDPMRSVGPGTKRGAAETGGSCIMRKTAVCLRRSPLDYQLGDLKGWRSRDLARPRTSKNVAGSCFQVPAS